MGMVHSSYLHIARPLAKSHAACPTSINHDTVSVGSEVVRGTSTQRLTAVIRNPRLGYSQGPQYSITVASRLSVVRYPDLPGAPDCSASAVRGAPLFGLL